MTDKPDWSDNADYIALVDPTAEGVDVEAPIAVRVVEQPISDRRPRKIVCGTIVSVGDRTVPILVVPEQPQRVRLYIQSNTQSAEVWGIGGTPDEIILDAANKVFGGCEVRNAAGGTAIELYHWGPVWAKTGSAAGSRLHYIAEFVDG